MRQVNSGRSSGRAVSFDLPCRWVRTNVEGIEVQVTKVMLWTNLKGSRTTRVCAKTPGERLQMVKDLLVYEGIYEDKVTEIKASMREAAVEAKPDLDQGRLDEALRGMELAPADWSGWLAGGGIGIFKGVGGYPEASSPVKDPLVHGFTFILTVEEARSTSARGATPGAVQTKTFNVAKLLAAIGEPAKVPQPVVTEAPAPTAQPVAEPAKPQQPKKK